MYIYMYSSPCVRWYANPCTTPTQASEERYCTLSIQYTYAIIKYCIQYTTIYIIVNVINYIILHVKILINFTCADHFQIKYFWTSIIFNYSNKPYLDPTMFHNGFELSSQHCRNQFKPPQFCGDLLTIRILIGSSNIEV